MLIRTLEPLFVSRWSDNIFQFGFQEWQVFADRGPNNIQINFEVGMDQTITHSTDIEPGDGTVLGAEFGRYFARRLADNLELFNQRSTSMRFRSKSARRIPWTNSSASVVASNIGWSLIRS